MKNIKIPSQKEKSKIEYRMQCASKPQNPTKSFWNRHKTPGGGPPDPRTGTTLLSLPNSRIAIKAGFIWIYFPNPNAVGYKVLPSEVTTSFFARTFSKWTPKISHQTKPRKQKNSSLCLRIFSPLFNIYWNHEVNLISKTRFLHRRTHQEMEWINGSMFFTNSSSALFVIVDFVPNNL